MRVKNPINEKIGYRLKERRLEAGLTIMKVCDLTHIKTNSLSCAERGIYSITLPNAMALAKLYGCTVEDFIKGIE